MGFGGWICSSPANRKGELLPPLQKGLRLLLQPPHVLLAAVLRVGGGVVQVVVAAVLAVVVDEAVVIVQVFGGVSAGRRPGPRVVRWTRTERKTTGMKAARTYTPPPGPSILGGRGEEPTSSTCQSEFGLETKKNRNSSCVFEEGTSWTENTS